VYLFVLRGARGEEDEEEEVEGTSASIEITSAIRVNDAVAGASAHVRRSVGVRQGLKM
jgi:hypothetical protein